MRIKIIMLSLLAVTAGVFAYMRPHNGIPSDLRDAVADSPLDTLKTEAGAEASGVSITKPTKPFYVETGSGKDGGNIPDPEGVSGISRFEGYKALLAERERAERALYAIAYRAGIKDPAVIKAENMYHGIAYKLRAWIVTAKIRLAGEASISSESECGDLAAAIRENDILTSYVSIQTGLNPGEGLFKLHTYEALCGTFLKTGILEKFLIDTQRAYNSADKAGRDKILKDIDALKWRFFILQIRKP